MSALWLGLTSFHMQHTKHIIPHCMSRSNCLYNHLRELTTRLLNRNYPRRITEEGIRQAKDNFLKELGKNWKIII